MIFHPLDTHLPKPERLNDPFYYDPHPLCLLAAEEIKAHISSRKEWQKEVEQGKMFGVLVVERPLSNKQTPPEDLQMDAKKEQLSIKPKQSGLKSKPWTTEKTFELGYLAAYSGQIGGRSDWEGFVPAVFNYLQPNGYFKVNEQKISLINREIQLLETNEHRQETIKRLHDLTKQAEVQTAAYKAEIKEAKRRRDEKRKIGANKTEEAAMIAESQFMKAELQRLKIRFRQETNTLSLQLEQTNEKITQLKEERKRRSDELQRWLFSHFVMRNARGEQRNLLDIFSTATQQLPPSGTGECCAPKLLQYAFTHGLRPISMAEFWVGQSPKTEVRREGCFYAACRGKCKPTLDYMLQGIDIDSTAPEEEIEPLLKIIYEDDNVAVVCKPAGMLTVPGKSNAPSVYSLMRARYPHSRSPLVVHRLDMATSGLLLIAKTKEAHRWLQQAFKNREIKKRYVALLEGVLPLQKQRGTISLPLSADYLDRPRQIVDYQNGKPAITTYEVIGEHRGHTLIALYPLTGRTHQLRVHCAHVDGLNMPILGDTLYGHKANRLYLHAEEITFANHLATGGSFGSLAVLSFKEEADWYRPAIRKHQAHKADI